VERAVDHGLAHIGRVLRADHDVAELARARHRSDLVDREREHIGWLIAPAMAAVELVNPFGVDELDRDVAVLDSGG
jgi:hypothetical protein